MRHLAWLGLLVAATVCGGPAYKSIGPDGTVTYSDRPAPNAEEVRLPEPSTYSAPTLPQSGGRPAPPVAPVSGGEYSNFAIVAPKNEETLHNRDRWVDVDLSLDPGLLEGDSFTLILDGAQLAKGLRTKQIRLTDVERGTHQLEASILDASGQEILRSAPIRFYLVTETLIKEPQEAEKEKIKEGELERDLTLGERVWDKWVQDLERYKSKVSGDPAPKTAPPVPPIGGVPADSKYAADYKYALKDYKAASDRFNETHGTFKQPAVDAKAPYEPRYQPPPPPRNDNWYPPPPAPDFSAPKPATSPYALPSKPPSYVPPPPRHPYTPPPPPSYAR
jgi:hypothetical protein